MLDLLIEGDHRKCLKFWREKMPNFPLPEIPDMSEEEIAEVAMHQARTMSAIPMTLRMWSHRWLVERGLTSMLPSEMVAKAMGLPIIESKAVGISVMALESRLQPACDIIRGAMESELKDMIRANNQLPDDNNLIRDRLHEVYDREADRLFGRNWK